MDSGPASVWIDVTEGTPLGPIWVAVTTRGLACVQIQGARSQFTTEVNRRLGATISMDPGPTAEAIRQIESYLEGSLQEFTLVVDWMGMRPFQARALRAASAIPYGRTSTYAALANQIGSPRGARAVGRAMATNPMPLVLPCHRLLGKDGTLRGYGAPGGLDTKVWLLELERSHADQELPIASRRTK